MQSPLSSRKRGVIGTNPTLQPPQQPFSDMAFQTNQDPNNPFGAQYMDWNNADGLGNDSAQFGNQSGLDGNIYDAGLDASLGLGNGAPIAPSPTSISSQLVRRNPNQQLATRGRTWQDGASTGMHQTAGAWDDEDDVELEQRALAAKRDAVAKRKQIPPFVQKLSSFLDESNNTDLIRWSDDGRSFIVLDEDEFAKTLIPELFKHNNYASFVRQLNMYGFHKKVGLSDNSMKASENKRKMPSEYWNKYFRRGRPELLWLIQKPKSPPTAKRKRDEGKKDDDSDEDRRVAVGETQAGSESAPGLNQDLTVIPKTELTSLRGELITLQRQQKLISGVISQIKRQNDQLYQQATAFQALHDRHESSINAILTFLATFYNRSLEGHSGANIADMFSHTISPNQSQHANIVDMGDLTGIDVDLNQPHQGQTPGRRRQPLALLPAPDTKPAGESPVTLPPSNRSTVSPKPRNQQPAFRPQSRSVRPPASPQQQQQQQQQQKPALSPQMKVDAESPNFLGDTSDIMSVINAANATTPVSSGPNLDFNSALEHYQTADGNAPLTPQRRNEVLNMIANTTNAGSPTLPAGATANVKNALTNPQPPPIPSLTQISQTREQLDMLQRLQEEQAVKVQDLAERLSPLSPSGQIPGFHDAAVGGTTVPPPDWNLDDWIDPNSGGFDWGNTNFDANNINFNNDLGLNFDGANDTDTVVGPNGTDAKGIERELFGDSPRQAGNDGRVESVSSRATSPTAKDDAEDISDIGSPRKRRRTGGKT